MSTNILTCVGNQKYYIQTSAQSKLYLYLKINNKIERFPLFLDDKNKPPFRIKINDKTYSVGLTLQYVFFIREFKSDATPSVYTGYLCYIEKGIFYKQQMKANSCDKLYFIKERRVYLLIGHEARIWKGDMYAPIGDYYLSYSYDGKTWVEKEINFSILLPSVDSFGYEIPSKYKNQYLSYILDVKKWGKDYYLLGKTTGADNSHYTVVCKIDLNTLNMENLEVVYFFTPNPSENQSTSSWYLFNKGIVLFSTIYYEETSLDFPTLKKEFKSFFLEEPQGNFLKCDIKENLYFYADKILKLVNRQQAGITILDKEIIRVSDKYGFVINKEDTYYPLFESNGYTTYYNYQTGELFLSKNRNDLRITIPSQFLILFFDMSLNYWCGLSLEQNKDSRGYYDLVFSGVKTMNDIPKIEKYKEILRIEKALHWSADIKTDFIEFI